MARIGDFLRKNRKGKWELKCAECCYTESHPGRAHVVIYNGFTNWRVINGKPVCDECYSLALVIRTAK